MCMSLEVMSGGRRGREEDKLLTFKVERGEKKAGRKEGGGGRGDINSAECLFPTKVDTVSFFSVMLACSHAFMCTYTCTQMLTHAHSLYTPVVAGMS